MIFHMSMKNMSNDWTSALGALLNSGNLPEGEEIKAEEPKAAGTKSKGRLVISYERKGRAGKEATIISGFTESHEEVAKLASQLKSKLGTGGSARGGEILIQGNRREQLLGILRQLGYQVNG